MQDQKAAKTRRLTIWFTINLVIFVLCYLNYRLQLKHRYLYKILNIGLCLSRAAAMVINFNLLLVWLPMCKYTLTRLACFACQVSSRKKAELNNMLMMIENEARPINSSGQRQNWLKTLHWSACRAAKKVRASIMLAKIKSIDSFLVAVDNCTSLHTICATTITLASVVHTVAHLMNVINFSTRFDPFLGNLNMAEFKGQNPLHLLVSVPGVTGCFMIIILLLMSLSSIHIIRNSSFDLFQIFHRLSIVFVILLILHPSSHVLKEQSNVNSYHPELCSQTSEQDNSSTNSTHHRRRQLNPEIIGSIRATNNNATTHETSAKSGDQNLLTNFLHNTTKLRSNDETTTIGAFENARHSNQTVQTNSTSELNYQCSDVGPKFVAQSSICWYVLSIGLSCYLFDLILRRLRRSKSAIELIEAKISKDGELIELIMSSNHRRFNNWLPGQFVYLNCPQIAHFEWHPFTISTMDYVSKQFTLHIKTGGDWTRQLKSELELRNKCYGGANSSATIGNNGSRSLLLLHEKEQQKQCQNNHVSLMGKKANGLFGLSGVGLKMFHCQVASSDCVDHRTGQLQIECKRLARVHDELSTMHCFSPNSTQTDVVDQQQSASFGHCIQVDLNNFEQQQQQQQLAMPPFEMGAPKPVLQLYVDGPFHSPFERLLEQQVAVCISNGVGWTAFSSVFQKLRNCSSIESNIQDKIWCSNSSCHIKHKATQQQQQQQQQNSIISDHERKLVKTSESLRQQFAYETSNNIIHLIVIVTTIEQLRPFYKMASCYFETKQKQDTNVVGDVTVYITRANIGDESVSLFCNEHNLSPPKNDQSKININEIFSINFGKPNFDAYLRTLGQMYSNRRKISVYCCGSYQVKQDVKGICRQLNMGLARQACIDSAPQQKYTSGRKKIRPIYCYHEENF